VSVCSIQLLRRWPWFTELEPKTERGGQLFVLIASATEDPWMAERSARFHARSPYNLNRKRKWLPKAVVVYIEMPQTGSWQGPRAL